MPSTVFHPRIRRVGEPREPTSSSAEQRRAVGNREAPTIRVVVESSAPAEQVLEAACDFSEPFADRFPDFHVKHFEVHEVGRTSAEVTEANPWPIGFVCERVRYDWSEPGCVKGTVIDSNVFKPGGIWQLKATPTDSGSRVEVVVVREPAGLTGHLIGIAIRLGLAKLVVASHLRYMLSRVERDGARRSSTEAHTWARATSGRGDCGTSARADREGRR